MYFEVYRAECSNCLRYWQTDTIIRVDSDEMKWELLKQIFSGEPGRNSYPDVFQPPSTTCPHCGAEMAIHKDQVPVAMNMGGAWQWHQMHMPDPDAPLPPLPEFPPYPFEDDHEDKS